MNYERLKRIRIPRNRKVTTWDLYHNLPVDAVIVEARGDMHDESTWLVVHSESWDVVPESESIPEHVIGDEEPETASPAQIRKALNAGTDYSGRMVRPGQTVRPHISPEPTVTIDYAELERRVMALCICDMAYTGLKYHKQQCPLVKKKP